jgi:hypothetical protein
MAGAAVVGLATLFGIVSPYFSGPTDSEQLQEAAYDRDTIFQLLERLDGRIREVDASIQRWKDYRDETGMETWGPHRFNESDAEQRLANARANGTAADRALMDGEFDEARAYLLIAHDQLDGVPPGPPAAEPPPPDAGAGAPGWVWVVLGPIALVVVGYLAYAYYQKKQDGS